MPSSMENVHSAWEIGKHGYNFMLNRGRELENANFHPKKTQINRLEKGRKNLKSTLFQELPLYSGVIPTGIFVL